MVLFQLAWKVHSSSSHLHHNGCWLQITESVFNFSKAAKVVNQSGGEVRQPGFLAIIGPKLAAAHLGREIQNATNTYNKVKYNYKYK